MGRRYAIGTLFLEVRVLGISFINLIFYFANLSFINIHLYKNLTLCYNVYYRNPKQKITQINKEKI